jgi:integrase
MARIEVPKRLRYDEVAVTTVSGADASAAVRRLRDQARSPRPLDARHLGPHRHAACDLRFRDLDLEHGTIRFREKGAKVIVKPLPDEFSILLRRAIEDGAIGQRPDAYLIPMARAQSRQGQRD